MYELAKRVMGTLIYIGRVSMNFDKSTRKPVVQALVLNLTNYYVQKLKTIAARVYIGGVKKYDHVSPAFREPKWLKVKQKHFLDIPTAVYKSQNKMFPA